ncbi:hypothetical protein [Halalkalicoccus subterraneus]|uniref:hypothetical protein n=1 Tax=Halalkalicoccus subterraneus TaxID=2675002 RepID=UPI0013CEA93F|nr:hypothetical protein [Halalkalicoccus subterraneus]
MSVEELLEALPNGPGRSGLSTTHPECYEREDLVAHLSAELAETHMQLPPTLSAVRLTQYQLGARIEAIDPDSNTVVDVHQINTTQADIAAMSPQRLLIRGPHQFTENIKQQMEQNLGREGRLLPIEFEPAFFLWIYAGHWHDTTARFDKITPIRLTGATMVGDTDTFGRDITLDGDELVTSSLIHAALLSENQFEKLRGQFELDDRYIQASLNVNGQVHVHVAGDLRQRGMAERFVTATRVVDQFVTEYLRWLELPRNERYPPASFFKQLDEAAEAQGLELSADIDDMLAMFAEQRGETINEYLENG